ncbi:MAG: glycosyltransferase family 4 protein, partial [Gemmatimonadota bacterium]
MRVLITTDVVGGVWSYTQELVDALARRGHVCALVAFGGEPSAAQTAWARGRPGLEFTAVRCPLEWMPEPEPGLSRSVRTLRRIARRFRPDVVHLNQFVYGAADLGAPKLVVAHSDVVTWWRTVRGGEPPDDAWFRRYRRWVRDGLEGAELRAAPSGWLAAAIAEAYGVDGVRVVHNARSPDRFGVASERVRPRRVVTAGRLWDEAKGARDLIPAARALAGEAEVVVAGEAAHPAGAEDFPTDSPGIRYAGVLSGERLRALYASAGVYAATSRYEPFGLAPLEAALAGCALVAADIPTFRELWDGCAVFYSPGDAAALADA